MLEDILLSDLCDRRVCEVCVCVCGCVLVCVCVFLRVCVCWGVLLIVFHSFTSYRKLVGMLIWLYKTRPDMLFTINLLARHLHNATKAHFDIARSRPLRYLSGTKTHGLVFCPGDVQGFELDGSAEADLAGDLATSRSTLGFYSKVGDYGPVSYNCSLERKVATSTQQAEAYACA